VTGITKHPAGYWRWLGALVAVAIVAMYFHFNFAKQDRASAISSWAPSDSTNVAVSKPESKTGAPKKVLTTEEIKKGKW
jgi:hypothetical protein